MSSVKGKARYLARMAAIQALYSQEQTQNPIQTIIFDFKNDDFRNNNPDVETNSPDIELFEHITNGTFEKGSAFDEIISKHIKKNWSADRLAPVMRSLIRCACFELIHDILTPTPVILDQYIEIAKDFFPDSDVAFVNGILNAIAKETRPQK